ncbi:nucleoside deaminase [Phycicoccus ginsengisoli]
MNDDTPRDGEQAWFAEAVREARAGLDEGGIPIGAALVSDGRLLATGRNRRVQLGSAIRHGETDCIERAGRQPADVYRHSTLFTTLSPCFMCAGTVLLYGIPRVVVGENRTFEAAESLLREHGVKVVVLDDEECVAMMRGFIADHPGLWHEDIGEPERPGSAAT